MKTRLRALRWRGSVAVVAVAAVATIGGFLLARGLTSEESPVRGVAGDEAVVSAQEGTPEAPPDEFPAASDEDIRRFEEDSQAPRFTGVIAGIQVSETERDAPRYPCDTGGNVAREAADGTDLELLSEPFPDWLQRWDFNSSGAYVCNALVVAAGESLIVDDVYLVNIQRSRVPEPWVTLGAPAERVSEEELLGRPVIIVEPLFPDGRVTSWIVFADQADEGWVVTTIEGIASPLDVVRRVAEEFLR